MQSAKAYPGMAMPAYPLFETTYTEPRNHSSDRPESFQKGVWLDVAAVKQRVSLRRKQDAQAKGSVTQPNDISQGKKEGSVRAKNSAVRVETSGTTTTIRSSHNGTTRVVSLDGIKGNKRQCIYSDDTMKVTVTKRGMTINFAE